MKYIKKRFISMDKPWKTEAWLSKMAEKGYFLRDVKRTTYFFEKADPQSMEYRIVYNKECDFGKRIIHYQEMGWDVVARDKKIIILGAKTYHRPSEEYLQEKERKAWKRKDLIGNIVLLLMGIVSFYTFAPNVLSFNTWNIINWHSFNADWSQWLSQVSIIILLVYAMGAWMGNYRYIKRIDKMGMKAHHGKGRRPVKYDALLGFVFLVVTLVNLPFSYEKYQNEESGVGLPTMPILREEQLAELVGGTKVTSHFPKYIYGVFTDGYVAASGCEEAREERVEYGDGRVEVDHYTVMDYAIRQEYHKMRIDRHRDRFMDSIVYDKQMVFDDRIFRRSKSEVRVVEGLDRVIYVKAKDNRYAFVAAKGPHILYVQVEKDIEEQKVLDFIKANLEKL